ITVTYKDKSVKSEVRVITNTIVLQAVEQTQIPAELKQGTNHTVSGIKAVWSDGTKTDLTLGDVTITSDRTDRIKINGGELQAQTGVTGLAGITVTYKDKSEKSAARVITNTKVLQAVEHNVLPAELKQGTNHTVSGIKEVSSHTRRTSDLLGDVTITSDRTDRIKINGGELQAQTGVTGLAGITVTYKD